MGDMMNSNKAAAKNRRLRAKLKALLSEEEFREVLDEEKRLEDIYKAAVMSGDWRQWRAAMADLDEEEERLRAEWRELRRREREMNRQLLAGEVIPRVVAVRLLEALGGRGGSRGRA